MISALALLTARGTARAQSPGDTHQAADWIERGKVDLKRYFFIEAESSFRKAIALKEDSATVHLLLTRALIGQLPLNLTLVPDSQGILPKAEQSINRALELSPENAEALSVLGIVNSKT